MFSITVKSIGEMNDEFYLKKDEKINLILKDPSYERLIYNKKRLALNCNKCEEDFKFNDFIEDEVEKVILFKFHNFGGPKIEHYIHPYIDGIKLIRDYNICKKCSKSALNKVKYPPSGILYINFSKLFISNGYQIDSDSLKNNITINDTSFISSENETFLFDIKKYSLYTSFTLKINTEKILLTNGRDRNMKADFSSSLFLEYPIQLVPNYWLPENGYLFKRDKSIRKELSILRTCVNFPEEIIIYIGRFL